MFKLRIIYYLFGFKKRKKRLNNLANLKEHQKKMFAGLSEVLKASSYYADLANKGADLSQYPIIDKSVFMAEFDRINTCGLKKDHAMKVAVEAEQSRDFSPVINGVTVGLSSGTSGNKGIFLASEKERARWVGAVLDRVIGFELRKRKVAFFLRANSNLYESVNSSILDFNFFDLMTPMPENVARLNQLKPHILVGQPSVLLHLAKAIENGELTLNAEKIISVAEVLEPQDKEYLEKVMGQTIHQVYQCTEGFLAFTCEHGTLHFNEDFLIIEKQYIDENKERFHPIITDTVRETQPVVRYLLNDIIHEEKNCPCGSPFTGIKQIEGRSDDVFHFKTGEGTDVSVFPDFIRRAVITASDQIQFYTVVQKSPNLLECYLEVEQDLTAVRKAVEASLTGMLAKQAIDQVNIEFIDYMNLEKGSKLRRVRNESSTAN